MSKEKIDFIFICGGDGTLLFLLKELPYYALWNKIFTFNFGHAGFLLHFNKFEVTQILKKIF